MTKTNNNELPTLEEIARAYVGTPTAVCAAAEIAVTLLPQLHALVEKWSRWEREIFLAGWDHGVLSHAPATTKGLTMTRCLKCRDYRIAGPCYAISESGKEVLRYVCVQCGYTYTTPTADAPPTPGKDESR